MKDGDFFTGKYSHPNGRRVFAPASIRDFQLMLDPIVAAESDKRLAAYVYPQGGRTTHVVKLKQNVEFTPLVIPRDRAARVSWSRDPRTLVGYIGFPTKVICLSGSGLRADGSTGGRCGFNSRSSSEPSREDRGYQGKEPKHRPNLGSAGLTNRLPNHLFGGVRRTSLLEEIFFLQAMLFGGFGAGLSYAFGMPPGKPSKPLWIALGTACAVGGLLALKVLLTGYAWLP